MANSTLKKEAFRVIEVVAPYYGSIFYLSQRTAAPYLSKHAKGPFLSEQDLRAYFNLHHNLPGHVIEGPVIQVPLHEEKRYLWGPVEVTGVVNFSFPMDEYFERFEHGRVQGPTGEAFILGLTVSFECDEEELTITSSSVAWNRMSCAPDSQGTQGGQILFRLPLSIKLYAPTRLPGKFTSFVEHCLKPTIKVPSIGEENVEATLELSTPL